MERLNGIPLGNPYGPTSLDRQLLQETFCRGLEAAGIDVYGYPQTFDVEENAVRGMPETAWQAGDFVVCPHIWDIPDDKEVWHRTPNFYDRATDTAIWWYKYALRDPAANKAVGPAEVADMMERLKSATRALGSTPYDYD